jgi:hypothetical protein
MQHSACSVYHRPSLQLVLYVGCPCGSFMKSYTEEIFLELFSYCIQIRSCPFNSRIYVMLWYIIMHQHDEAILKVVIKSRRFVSGHRHDIFFWPPDRLAATSRLCSNWLMVQYVLLEDGEADNNINIKICLTFLWSTRLSRVTLSCFQSLRCYRQYTSTIFNHP